MKLLTWLVVTILVLIASFYGICDSAFKWYYYTSNYVETTAIIFYADCKEWDCGSQYGAEECYECHIQYEYGVGDQLYSGGDSPDDRVYNIGESYDIYYSLNDFSISSSSIPTKKYINIGLVTFASLVFLLASGVICYLVFKINNSVTVNDVQLERINV